jgi:hypothetical protein
LKDINEIEKGILNIMPEVYGKDNYDFFEVAFAIIISRVAKKASLSEEQCEDLLRKSTTATLGQKSTNVFCTIFVTGSEYHTAVSLNSAPLAFDNSIEVIEQLSLSEIADTIKIKYKNRFI